MKVFVHRALSYAAGAAAAVSAYWQWLNPDQYPWPLAVCLLLYVTALGSLMLGRLRWRDALEKTLPSLMAMAVLGLRFLLADSQWEKAALLVLFAGIPFLVLELSFFLIYAPSRYPVNGLSRVNLALGPLSFFVLAATLAGLVDFVRLAWWIPLVVSASFGAVFFLLTEHPAADRGHRWRWTLFGGIIGLQVGILVDVLPVGMAVHGALAALLFALPLRLRRYSYQPYPSRRLALTEIILAVLAFLAVLAAAKWL